MFVYVSDHVCVCMCLFVKRMTGKRGEEVLKKGTDYEGCKNMTPALKVNEWKS